MSPLWGLAVVLVAPLCIAATLALRHRRRARVWRAAGYRESRGFVFAGMRHRVRIAAREARSGTARTLTRRLIAALKPA
jgi:hypothetical protein